MRVEFRKNRKIQKRCFVGKVITSSCIIALQVANLKSTTRKIDLKAKELSKVKPTITQIALTGANQQPTITTSYKPQEWQLIEKKEKKKNQPSQKGKDTLRRLILIQSGSQDSTFSPLSLRNQLNRAFTSKGYKEPVIATVSRSLSKNIIITTTPTFTSNFLIEKEAIWKGIIPYTSIQKDESWYKVILHGVPTADFNTLEGMQLVVDEIRTFNKGYQPIGTPYWLSSEENRRNKLAGSVVVTFATEKEAIRARRERLYIAGISVRVEKLHSTAPTTQCTKCQGFGHLDHYCKRQFRCKLCSEYHSTSAHYCSICKKKGGPCPHLEVKCVNCKGPHMANNKACKTLQAID